jgi:tetratricopeptide (TPR) repeat protein
LQQLGRINDAQQRLDSAGEVQRGNAVAADSPSVLTARIAQALVWQSQGRLREADQELADVQASHARLRLKVGASTQVLILRAEIATAEGRLDDAQRLADQALDIARDTQGDFEVSSITGHAWLASAKVLHARGSTEQARAACQSAREHLVRRVGASHPHAQEADRLARTLSS